MKTRPIARRRFGPALTDRTLGELLLGIAGLFVVCGSVALHLSPYPLSLTVGHLVAVVGGWAVAWAGSAWLLNRRLGSYDRLIFSLVAMLTGWGLLLQARLAPALLYRQVAWLLIGCSVMCGVALTPTLTRLLRRYRYSLLTAGILLLGATLIFGVNPSGFGQRLWLGARGLFIQPSEPLKLLLVVYLAAYLADKRDLPRMKSAGKPMWLIVLGPMVAMVGLALVLLGWQQDLGAALLFYLTFVMMIFLAWGHGRYALLSLALFAPVGLAGYVLSDRVALRVSIWLDPWAPAQADRAFQILQSLFAFGSGGLVGQGLGQGSPGLIPAVHTDFVYAALAEEFGLIGALGVIVLIAAVAYRGLRIAQRTEAGFESLLAGGVAALLCVQTWVIAGGNVRLIPITGVTFPFLSHGGSSLVTMLAAIGLLLNLSGPHPPPLSLALLPEANRPLRDTAARLGYTTLALLASIAATTGLWSVARAEQLRAYPSNPRLVLAERRIRRGRILDRNSEVLADIALDTEGFVTRTYPLPEGAPVVGYATLAYGTDGIESSCDARLRGEQALGEWERLRRQLLHIDPVGRDVRLTIDARLQAYAQQRLAGLVGAAVLIDARTGEILALASSPTYDAATIVTAWSDLREAADSPFLNRATQGLAQPGTALQPFLLASALQQDPALVPATPLDAQVPFDGMAMTCRHQPTGDGWDAVLAAACPYPFTRIARAQGTALFSEALTRWGLLDAPALTLPTVAADLQDLPLQPAAEAAGQGRLLVTPLQMARAIGALGNDGLRPDLSLLTTPVDGCTPTAPSNQVQVMDSDTAEQVRRLLARYDGAIGHLGTSFAGPERQQAWFIGLNSADVPRYAVAVLVDRIEEPGIAAEIGSDLLRSLSDLQRLGE